MIINKLIQINNNKKWRINNSTMNADLKLLKKIVIVHT